MIAKALGYLIGGALVLAFFAPVPAAIWLVYDRVDILLNANTTTGTVIRCASHRSSSSRALAFGPVARTESGLTVKGTFRFSKRDWCTAGIGDEVSILLDRRDADNSRIYTFFQFWFLPLLMSAIGFVLYPLLYLRKWRSREKS